VTCEAVREALIDYLDAALPEAERAEVTAHLSSCEACRAEAEALRWAEGALAPLTVVEEAPAADAADLPWLRPRPRAWRWALAAVAVGAALLLLMPHRTPRPVKPGGGRHEVVAAPQPAPERPAAHDVVAPAPVMVKATPTPHRRTRPPEPTSIAIIIVEPPADVPPVSSYRVEVALPDGTSSDLTQTVSRDATGVPREITVAYAQGAEGRRER
jgi:hypothetical protein